MKNFAAIDFETANNERSSVCSVGIVIVKNGEIVDSFYSLILPEPNYYNYWCCQVHGLGHNDTDNAPIFPEVWKQIEPLIKGLPLVAHNKLFDEGCLKAVFRVYQMEYPGYRFTTHCRHRGANCESCPTTNSRLWQKPAATNWKTITTRWLTQRLAHG